MIEQFILATFVGFTIERLIRMYVAPKLQHRQTQTEFHDLYPNFFDSASDDIDPMELYDTDISELSSEDILLMIPDYVQQ